MSIAETAGGASLVDRLRPKALEAELPELLMASQTRAESANRTATYRPRSSFPGRLLRSARSSARTSSTPPHWLVVRVTALRVDLKPTWTITFGHVETPRHWARHLITLADPQIRSAGFTEFVSLPFVHGEAPSIVTGQRTRTGPTLREALLMHAVPRLALQPHVTNIQASGPKLGVAAGQLALQVGTNDCDGTLMNEPISRAAGAEHGQVMPPERMTEAIWAIGRSVRQRTTLYGDARASRVMASFGAPAMAEPHNPPVKAAGLKRPAHLVRPGLGR